jgi:hypothetical protein
MTTQFQDVLVTIGTKSQHKDILKAVPTEKVEQPSVAQYVDQPTPPPEWRVVEKSASHHNLIDRPPSRQSRLSSARTYVSSMGLASFSRPHAGANIQERHTSSYEEGTNSLKNGIFLPWTEGIQKAEEVRLEKEAKVCWF